MLAPEGYGEIIGGGERVSELRSADERLREHNLPEEAFSGIWTCGATAACRTRASAWAWNARWRGFAELSTFAK